jgi:hypothetical protein
MSLIYLVLACFIGVGLLRWMFPAPPKWSLHSAWLLSVGAGLGIGIASSLYFLCLASVGPRIAVVAGVEAAALLAVVILVVLIKRNGTQFSWAAGPPMPLYLVIICGAVCASAVIMFVVYTLTKPHGEWDAWSIWNLRARFLYRGGDAWKNAFSSQIGWSHPSYPVLWPGIVALCWTLARNDSTLAPAAVAFIFVFGAAGVLVSSLGILRGKTQAMIAGIVLLGGSQFITFGANQYADIPVGYFIVTALALLCLQDRFPGDARFSIMAGLMAGFAAWTKNEGLLFLAAVTVARAWALWRYGAKERLKGQLLRFVAGFAAPLAIVVFFKLRYGTADDLLSKQPRQIFAHLADFGRWITLTEAYVKAPFHVGAFLVPIVLVLAVYWYLVRFKVDERDRPALATIIGAIGLTLAGEFLIYVAFPDDMIWQINTSLERLFLQMWPAGLLAFLLAASPPQIVEVVKEAAKAQPAKRASKPARRAAETR